MENLLRPRSRTTKDLLISLKSKDLLTSWDYIAPKGNLVRDGLFLLVDLEKPLLNNPRVNPGRIRGYLLFRLVRSF